MNEPLNESSAHIINRALDSKLFRILSVAGLIVLFLLISFLSLRRKTITHDEPQHLAYGIQVLAGDSDRLVFRGIYDVDDSKMPVSALNALPSALADSIPIEAVAIRLAKVESGRWITIGFAALLAVLVFAWSRTLYGWLAGLLSLSLFVLDPNIIAHSQLITTDLYAALTITLATFTFWRFCKTYQWRDAALAATALGLAQLSKYTALFLFPLFLALVLIREAPRWLGWIQRRETTKALRSLGRGLLFAMFFIIISFAVINVGYFFNRSFTPFSEYSFDSDVFHWIEEELTPLEIVPVPLPYPYVQGLDQVRFRERTGEGNRYLLGSLKQGEGFPGYFLYVYLYKVPLATQLIVLIALAVYIARRNPNDFLQNELFLLGPVLFFLIYFNFFFRVQTGIRFLLVVFPFLFVFCGTLLRDWREVSRRMWVALVVLLSLLALSTLSYFPHYLAYFNALVPDRRYAYRVLADSNIEWGQAEWYLDRYLEQHPQAQFEPDELEAGTLIVSVNRVTGVVDDPPSYVWLQDGFRPVGTIGYVYLVYEISPQDMQRLKE